VPQAGYGKYPVNMSILVSQETADEIEAEANARSVSKATVARERIERGRER
jgi:hypothetical protein